ncbi:hypothetical protein N9V35_00745 [bacterium]|nr:hypothetical protein [bacterium]
MKIKLIIILFILFSMPASSFWSDENENVEKSYKEFIFDNSMKPIFVINLKKLKNMAIKLCGSDIYKNDKSCKFILENDEIKIYRAKDNKIFIYNLKEDDLRSYSE